MIGLTLVTLVAMLAPGSAQLVRRRGRQAASAPTTSSRPRTASSLFPSAPTGRRCSRRRGCHARRRRPASATRASSARRRPSTGVDPGDDRAFYRSTGPTGSDATLGTLGDRRRDRRQGLRQEAPPGARHARSRSLVRERHSATFAVARHLRPAVRRARRSAAVAISTAAFDQLVPDSRRTSSRSSTSTAARRPDDAPRSSSAASGFPNAKVQTTRAGSRRTRRTASRRC